MKPILVLIAIPLAVAAVVLLAHFVACLRRSRQSGATSDVPMDTGCREEDLPLPDVSTPSGLKVAVSAGPARKKLPQSEDECRIVRQMDAQRDYNCGHSGAEQFVVSIYGLHTKEVDQKERCPDCFLEWMKGMCIRCALCGLPIFPGEGVALYGGGGGLRLDIATRVGDSVIGCLRWDCCPSGGFFAGHWTEDGFKPAFDGETGAEKAFSTESMVVGNV